MLEMNKFIEEKVSNMTIAPIASLITPSKKKRGSCNGCITLVDGGDDVFIHCQQLVHIEGLQQGETVSYDTAKSKRHVNTEDSYSYIGTKVTTSSSNVKLDSRMCHRIHGHERGDRVEALMTPFTQQLVAAVIKADSIFFQSNYGDGLKFWCGTELGLEVLSRIWH